MNEDQVIKTLKTKAQVITNAWYGLHVLNIDKIGPFEQYLRTRFAIDRQLCYNLIHIICRYLENMDVIEEMQGWINSALAVSPPERIPYDLISLRMNFLKEVIDNELNGLEAGGKVSGFAVCRYRAQIAGLLEFVKKEYIKAALKQYTKEPPEKNVNSD